MILDKIMLFNFGLYSGTQTITLTPKSSRKPIVLIGGLNGGGKTTLLDALQLCFFGPHAKTSNRGALSYQEYLSRSIHRGGTASEASVEISFRYRVEGREDSYKLRRSWILNDSGCNEKFEVTKNGEPEKALADNWASQVDEFFPANIAHLFLFDGEQVEAYASQGDSSTLIRNAIQNLLGLDIVDRLDKDLVVYERRKRTENKNDPLNAEIVKLQDQVRELRNCVITLKQERAALQTHQIDRKKAALRKAENNYQKVGGALYDQRENIEKKLQSAKQAVASVEAELRDLAAGALPLVLVKEILESARTRDQYEEECRRSRNLLEALEERDSASLLYVREIFGNEPVVEMLSKYFSDDRAARQTLAKEKTVLDFPPEARSDLYALLKGDIERLTSKARAFLGEHKSLSVAMAQAQMEHENIPNLDTMQQVITERDAHRNELAELELLCMALEQSIERQERELERRVQELERLIESDSKEHGLREDRARILRHSGKVRQSLVQFRRVVIERNVSRIENLVLESYKHLLRKTALVTRLSIDPDTFSVTLYGRDAEVLSPERLSAGERQLLAIALLWGLAKASGRPLPTAIDTPLGRLDSSHRVHLVERYLPFASHQVLLFSTDEEIIGEYYERLKPWVGLTYQLSYDDSTGGTTIKSGYFKARAAA